MLDYLEFYQDSYTKRQQLGVVRTSCLDSLDRTNVVQAEIAWRILKIQFAQHKIDPTNYYSGTGQAFVSRFRSLWSANGNYLSIQYSGAESTTSSLTKEGKGGVLHSISSGINSVNRFIKNNFSDDLKQKCIDCLLNNSGDSIPQQIREAPINSTKLNEANRGETIGIEEKDMKFFFGTWNLAGGMPDESINISKWIGVTEAP